MTDSIPGRDAPEWEARLEPAPCSPGAFVAGSTTVVHFVQPDRLINMNDRGHWAPRARRISDWRTMARHAGRQLRPKADRVHGPSLVEARLPVRDRRDRDPHNYAPTMKAIIDGLTDAGYWPDDNSQWVATLEPVLVVRRDGLVVVTLEPMERPNR